MSSTLAVPSLTITSVTSAGGLAPLSSVTVPGQSQSLPAGTSISAVSVKQERHDEAEIQEMANKFRETQKAAMAKQLQQQLQQQLQVVNRQMAGAPSVPGTQGQANILNYLTRKNPTVPGANGQAVPPATATANGKKPTTPGSENGSDKKTCDEESQKGHFGWVTFGQIFIPYIVRQSEKYCAVRMVEMKLLNKYLSHIHPDIYSSCTCVRSYYITEAESRLLNEINHKHCDGQFGREMFTLKDLVVRLSDANKFYQFLDICYRKMLNSGRGPSEKCGFIRINKESVVPYTIRQNEQVVPLFYFEGETENLRQKAEYLAGWDLAYLKFCCKVQGIRNELFSSESVAVISLTDIKSYFPTGTEFEDYWPSKIVDSNLLLGSKNMYNSVQWTRQPSAPPPKILNTGAPVPKPAQQQPRKPPPIAASAAMQALTNGWTLANAQGGIPPGILHAQSEVYNRLAQAQQAPQRGYPNNRNTMQNLMARQQYNYNNGGMSITSMNCTQQQQPPPLVRSASQSQSHMSTVAAANAVLQQQHHQQHQQHQQQQQQQQQRANSMQNGRSNQTNASMSAAMHLQRHAAASAASAAMDVGGLRIIPELTSRNASTHEPPFKLQKNFVFENTMVPCVNLKPYNYADQLMTLTDFREFFFPNVPLDHCKRFMVALNVDMYQGNRQQTQLFIDSGKPHSENIPLILIRDVNKYMPQLRYMMRTSQIGQDQPPNKRTRIS